MKRTFYKRGIKTRSPSEVSGDLGNKGGARCDAGGWRGTEPPAIRPVARLQASTKHKAAGCKYTGEPQTCKRDSPRSAERQHQNLKFDASGRSQSAKERGDGSVSEGGVATCGERRRLAAGHD